MAEDPLKGLDHRVNRLENIAWVLGALAVAFGIAGGSLWGKLMSAREKASELETKVQVLIAQKDDFDKVVQGGIAKIGSATESGVQQIITTANAEATKIDGLARKAVDRHIEEINRKSFTVRVSGRVGTGPDVERSNEPRQRDLGSHAFCALGSTNMVKETEVCGCQLSPDGNGPNPGWVLKVNAKKNEPRHCECTAVCLDRLTTR
jgi:hypothetical protein